MSTLDEVISRAVQTAVHKYMDVFLQIVSEKYQINQDELKALLSQSSTGGNKEYAKLNLKQLRSLCKERNIKQFSLKKKGELIELLEDFDKNDQASMAVLVDDQESSISSEGSDEESNHSVAHQQESLTNGETLEEIPAVDNVEISTDTPVEEEISTDTPVEEEISTDTPVEEEISTDAPVEEEPVLTQHTTNVDYSKMNMDQLKKLCREKGIKKVSGKRKECLIEFLSKPVEGKLRTNSQVDLMEEAQILRSSMEGVNEILVNQNVYNLNFDELREVCKIRGIDVRNKKKKELIHCLETFDQHDQNFDSALVNDDDIF
jgi:hypothetical protein